MKNNKFDEDEIFKLAMELPNPRMPREVWQDKFDNIPPLQRRQDFKERALSGGELTFIEAKMLTKEQLSYNHWMITYYEMVQFPQYRLFETEAAALDYFTRSTVDGQTPRGTKIMPQRMELYGPKNRIYGERQVIKEWKSPGYKPDPMTCGYR